MTPEQKKAASERMKKMNAERRQRREVEKQETQPSKRQLETQAKRRRRRNVKGEYNWDGRLKLGVDPATKDPNYEYRWINDENGRLQQKIGQDWDPVTVDGKEIEDPNNIPMEGIVRRPVGAGSNGQPVTAVLCRKHKDWYDSDRQDMYKDIEETDRQIARGKTPKAEVENSYVPDDGAAIKITRA